MLNALVSVLREIDSPVIAVSGGVDSVTLAALAAAVLPTVALMHAASAAVPPEATERVRTLAARHGWPLTVIDAGEFADPLYRANPVNRCFHCKANLYGTIRARTGRPILSGANTDDLREYRPGLDAARQHGVRHPYIEAGMDKRGVRRLARELGLDEVAELPASPCLSSRIETGIRIEPQTLGFIHAVERLVSARIRPRTVRCRVRSTAIVIELDGATLGRLHDGEARLLAQQIDAETHRPPLLPVVFEPYRNGSAFLVQS